jgi:glycosyltransferase involved in cell wall biosynthesis
MATPFISICIPAYKRVDHLRRLLQSIADQSFSDYELIITDDSPDNSVEKLLSSFTNLTYLYSKNTPAAGSPSNWNIAIEKASGKWIKLMHADDWFSSSFALQQFADAAENTSNDFIFSACRDIHLNTGDKKLMIFDKTKKKLLDNNFINLLYDNVIGHPSTIMHKKDTQLVYDTNFIWLVDIDFYIRYLQKHGAYTYLPDILINIGVDDTQVSNACYKNPDIEIPEYLSLMEKFSTDLIKENKYIFHCLWNLVKKFRLKNTDIIREHGFLGEIPAFTKGIIEYQKKIPRIIIKQTPWSKALMSRCYKKLIKV